MDPAQHQVSQMPDQNKRGRLRGLKKIHLFWDTHAAIVEQKVRPFGVGLQREP
ncbi:hypothetical protein N7454_003724 [Penicillium verhagenii]|nr:hypothetical protein N7454_003724 [Penicillium verhagenii]